MKKLVSILLALALASSIGAVTVFAAGGSETGLEPTDKEIGVNAKYVDGTTGGEVISIDLSWGAMEFTYTETGSKTWNPETHEYDANTSTDWTASGNEITVTNHSNAAVNAAFKYDKATGFDSCNGTFSSTSVDLPSAEGKAVDDSELKSTVTFTVSGTIDSSVVNFTKVGTITVTLS